MSAYDRWLDTERHRRRDNDDMNPLLAQVLCDTSPQMFLNGRPALMRYQDSPTGWIVVHPGPTPNDELVTAVDAALDAWMRCPNPNCHVVVPHHHAVVPDPDNPGGATTGIMYH